MKTPIILITGSLGSGKTTLLKRILETAHRRIAVLMNEFGEIAIDSQVIQGENVQIVELIGGCVCCSLTGEFEAAVAEIIDTIHPEHIVVETTGVAEADALVFEVEDSLPQVRLDSVVCLVDAYMTIKYPHIGYTTRTQLEVADVILINKVDLVTPGEIKQVEGRIQTYNDGAYLFKTVKADVNIKLLFGLEVHTRETAITAHSHTEFQSFTFSTDRLLDREKFQEVVSELPPSVYRAKGFVVFPEGSYLFNYVVGRPDLEKFEADRTQLVFIGPDLKNDEEAILSRLHECEM